MNKEDTLEKELIEAYLKPELDKIEASEVKQLTKEQWEAIDERDRKICMGEWDGPETPYIKYIREFYKDRDWTKKDE